MQIKAQHLVSFSATNSTRKLVREIGKKTGYTTADEYNMAMPNRKFGEVNLTSSDLLIVGVPSYAGRVPSVAVADIEKFRGDNTPAIIVCTYGNRDYDDTLLELKDIVSCNGFKVVSAGAFVAQHSIFPQVGEGRPDERDQNDLEDFVRHSVEVLNDLVATDNIPEIQVKGNYPYRPTGNIPLKPNGNRKCNECGTCVQLCPTGAISADNPRKTNKEKCISCARCIAVCPQDARAFRGLIYSIAKRKFVKAHQQKQPNIVEYI